MIPKGGLGGAPPGDADGVVGGSIGFRIARSKACTFPTAAHPLSCLPPAQSHPFRYGATHWPTVCSNTSETISDWVRSSATAIRRRFRARLSGIRTYRGVVASLFFGRRAGGGVGVSGSADRGVAAGGVEGPGDRGARPLPTARPAGRWYVPRGSESRWSMIWSLGCNGSEGAEFPGECSPRWSADSY